MEPPVQQAMNEPERLRVLRRYGVLDTPPDRALDELTALAAQIYQVRVAANAADAVTIFDRHPDIDVLLTDVIMPGASGADLARTLLARRPSLKVVFMSGYTDDAIAHHDVYRRGTAFLAKPFTSEALSRKLREVLDR